MGGNVTVVTSNRITFLPGGKFRLQRTGATLLDSSRGPVGGGASSSSSIEGTYRLDGSTIEFRHPNGAVDRRAFHWGDPKRKGSVFLNETLFALEEEKKP